MKKTFLIATAIAMLPYMVSAKLLVSARDADLGKLCWDTVPELTTEYRLVKCTPGTAINGAAWFATCGSSYYETSSDVSFISGGKYSSEGLLCILGGTQNAFYLCANEGGRSVGVCKDAVEAVWNELPEQEMILMSDSNGREYLEYYNCDNNNYNEIDENECHLSCSIDKKYYCSEGFYKSGGIDYSSSMQCSHCPENGTSYGPPNLGSITQCYLPAGTSFCDDTGCGKYKEKCYYKND